MSYFHLGGGRPTLRLLVWGCQSSTLEPQRTSFQSFTGNSQHALFEDFGRALCVARSIRRESLPEILNTPCPAVTITAARARNSGAAGN
ncbi:jg735 [Pararge aegeria aegeria]|uniref:Jg735 protein n=1 Tax=Pararge aegeria aegeria TaxID=348720 RepID=A0A8S4S769_9NEOP|nr:jg735 [Pararge aegeria aegeria]